MIAWKQVSAEVLYTDAPLSVVSRSDVELFRQMAADTPRRRLRLCTHQAPEDALHEMLILVSDGSYIRPHRHFARPESLLVMEGRADAVFFSDDGDIERVIRLSSFGDAGEAFYYRIEQPKFHTLLLTTPWLVLVECSLGPFDPARSEFAPWSPDESDHPAVRQFCATLATRAQRYAR